MNLLFGNHDSKHKLSNFQHKINYIKNCIHKYHIHTLFLIINLLILVYYIITTIYAHKLLAVYFTFVFIMLFSPDGYYSIGFTNLMDYDDNYNTDIKTIFENIELVHKNIGKPNL